ncbi:MAG: class I SAM-dependent methyltransferase [Candidatus Hydrogenedentes bacterium]|nr:class I SAM-dependent methyltransferase [Candidatus Hydrogenedentota bacterium]
MSITNPRTSVLAGLIAAHCGIKCPSVLVVGCGRGIEAAVLAQDLGADVTGIDLDPRFDPEAARYASLTLGDATKLDFPDASFDIVYSYHALEHIPGYHKALDEMHRVLRGGAYGASAHRTGVGCWGTLAEVQLGRRNLPGTWPTGACASPVVSGMSMARMRAIPLRNCMEF